MMHRGLHELITFVASKLNPPWPVIYQFQNAPRIAKPYITIRIDTQRVPGHVIYGEVTAEGTQNVAEWHAATVELQSYGADAASVMRKVALLLQTETALDQAVRLNLAIGLRLFESEVPEMVNLVQYEERGIFQFELLFTESLDDDVGLIETVIVDGSYTGGATDSVTCTEVITIDPTERPVTLPLASPVSNP